MLNLDLDSWLIRTKNPKVPVNEASLYSLCQLYSCHALAYTTGSVWSTLELHGNYSVNELKRHCDIHLVFLEGGILAQLHKKPSILRLMSGSLAMNLSLTVQRVSHVVRNMGIALPSDHSSASVQDHTYTSPTQQVRTDVVVNAPLNEQKCE